VSDAEVGRFDAGQFERQRIVLPDGAMGTKLLLW
jgi:hypothetical protein